MVTAKANGLVFDGWWKERVRLVEGATTSISVLYADYKREVPRALQPDAFKARLRGFGLVVGRSTVSGVRLLPLDAERAPPASPPPRAPAARKRETDPSMKVGAVEEGVETRANAAVGIMQPIGPGVVMAPVASMTRQASATPGGITRLYVVEAGDSDEAASAGVMLEVYRARRRQVLSRDEGGEGFSNAEDDRYGGQLALASASYAFAAGQPEDYRAYLTTNGKPARDGSAFGWHVLDVQRRLWPWDAAWWKPKTPREDLVRAAALAIAAIEKIDRATAREAAEAEEARLTTGV